MAARLPEVPVIVIVEVDAAAVLAAMSVSVLEVVAVAGLKDAVTPDGNPEAAKLTVPLNPFSGLTVMVLVPLDPAPIVSEPEDAVSPNDGWPDAAVKLSIRDWPWGVPQPVTRS